MDGLELEQPAQVVARRGVNRVAPERGQIDGGHGRIASTVNPPLVWLNPPALTTSE